MLRQKETEALDSIRNFEIPDHSQRELERSRTKTERKREERQRREMMPDCQELMRRLSQVSYLEFLLIIVLFGREAVLQAGGTEEEGSLLYNDVASDFESFDSSPWNTTEQDPCIASWQHVTCDSTNTYVVALNLQNLGISGTLNSAVSGLSYLQTLNLGNNSISGAMPSSLGSLAQLRVLNMSYNDFSGTIPASLASLNLTTLSVAYNNLSGPIPDGLLSFCFSGAFLGNDGLSTVCPTASPPPPPVPDSVVTLSTGGSNTGAVVGGVVGGILVCLVLAAVLLWLWVRRRREGKQGWSDLEREFPVLPPDADTSFLLRLKKFPLAELEAATQHFAPALRLGEGGYSTVFRGVLADGKEVAVKRLKEGARRRGEQQFLGELDLISRTVHRSLLRLEGFGMEGGERLLVFPLMPLGSVAAHLKGGTMGALPWEQRVPIALGAAEGLTYMHADCSPPVLHGDVKADNILLDADYRAVVADFGLARHLEGEEDARQITDLRGTLGYIAPEYPTTGQVSTKTDVYAFGVFLVELALGRALTDIVDDPDAATCTLHEWVIKLLMEGRVLEAVEQAPAMAADALEQVEQLLRVAVLCLQEQPEERLSMHECTTLLQGEGLADRWNTWQRHFTGLVDVHSDTMSLMRGKWGTENESNGTGTGSWQSSNYGLASGPVELSGPR